MAGIGSLFTAMDTALSGLFTSQLSLQTINSNVANANTPGYSRQRVSLLSHTPFASTVGAIGRGVRIGDISRITDALLQGQVYQQNSVLGTYTSMSDSLQGLEEILGSVENDRLGAAMTDFFNAWSELASPGAPAGMERAVLEAGRNLATQFSSVRGQIATLEEATRAGIADEITSANELLVGIGELNSQIVSFASPTGQPNDLLDMRDQLVDQLSSLVALDTINRDDGTVDVIVAGRSLVTGKNVQLLRFDSDDAQLRMGNGFGVPVSALDGSIAGHLRALEEITTNASGAIDDLAQNIMQRVNELHRSGISQGGVGLEFFTGSSAATMRVNSILLDDPSLVVTGASGEAGDMGIALQLAELGDATDADNPISLNERYTSMLLNISSQRSTYETLANGQESIVQGVRNRLESVRGVDIDEEMSNLILMQRTYEANARVISIVDEMLDTLINRMI